MKRAGWGVVPWLLLPGCGDDTFTMRAGTGDREGLVIDERKIVPLDAGATAADADLQFSMRWTYGLSGMDPYRDLLCPVPGEFAVADEIPLDAPCEGATFTMSLGSNTLLASARPTSRPNAYVFYRARDGKRFRLLFLEHGVEDTTDGSQAFATFELAD